MFIIQVQYRSAKGPVIQKQMDEPAQHTWTAYLYLFAFAHKTLFLISIVSKTYIFKLFHWTNLLSSLVERNRLRQQTVPSELVRGKAARSLAITN